MSVAPTPRDVLMRDGTAELTRFRPVVPNPGPVVLLIPSLINRWYVIDLHKDASLVKACVEAGLDTYCLDWGIPRDEDRYLNWDDVLGRLGRAVRRVLRETGREKIGLLGYCMGGTLSGIYTALHPEQIEAFVNLAGPFDFEHAGVLGEMTDPRWFDAEVVASAGNVAPQQMQSGFVSMRPTSQISKWVSYANRMHDPVFRESFDALDTWASDNIPFPGAAYVTYIKELYQENLLVKGEHYVGGKRVDLGNITCPTLTIATSSDHICPPKAAQGLHDHVGSADKEMVTVRGGHVGAVVGSKASTDLYPIITDFFRAKLSPNAPQKKRVSLVSDPPVDNPTARVEESAQETTKTKKPTPRRGEKS